MERNVKKALLAQPLCLPVLLDSAAAAATTAATAAGADVCCVTAVCKTDASEHVRSVDRAIAGRNPFANIFLAMLRFCTPRLAHRADRCSRLLSDIG